MRLARAVWTLTLLLHRRSPHVRVRRLYRRWRVQEPHLYVLKSHALNGCQVNNPRKTR